MQGETSIILSQKEIVKAMDANMHFHMTYFAKCTPSMHIIPVHDAIIVWSNIPDDDFNQVVASRFTKETAHARIEEIILHFKKAKLPFSWWISESDTPANIEELLTAQGLTKKENDVGMYMPLSDYAFRESNISLHLQRVDSKKSLRDFSEVIVEIGGHEDSFDIIYDKIPPEMYKNNNSFQMYVGYVDEKPTVSGILVLHNNVAGIYYICTVPSQRKKGYATAMMDMLLRNAKQQGYAMATLQASPEGKWVYEKMGFKSCCMYKQYA